MVCALIVQDDFAAIGDALRFALARADHVFTTAASGPRTTTSRSRRSRARSGASSSATRASTMPCASGVPAATPTRTCSAWPSCPRARCSSATRRSSCPRRLTVDGKKTVHWFPGEPAHFKRQFDRWKKRFEGTRPFALAQAFLKVDEGEIARDLREVEARHGVAIGSYPEDTRTPWPRATTSSSRSNPRTGPRSRRPSRTSSAGCAPADF